MHACIGHQGVVSLPAATRRLTVSCIPCQHGHFFPRAHPWSRTANSRLFPLLSAQGDTSVATVPNEPADGSDANSPSVPPAAATLEQQLVTNQQKQQSNGQPPQQQGGDAAAEVLEQQQQQAATPEPKKPSGNFIKRVIAGVVLGLGGAAVVAVGNLPYLLVAMLVVYQATQEYYGFITSKGISAGMTPPPPFVSAMTTALCLSITVLTYVTRQVGF